MYKLTLLESSWLAFDIHAFADGCAKHPLIMGHLEPTVINMMDRPGRTKITASCTTVLLGMAFASLAVCKFASQSGTGQQAEDDVCRPVERY